MKYQIKKTSTEEVEAGAEVSLAVATFKKLQKALDKAEALEEELNGWVGQIPKEDLDAYVRITASMEK